MYKLFRILIFQIKNFQLCCIDIVECVIIILLTRNFMYHYLQYIVIPKLQSHEVVLYSSNYTCTERERDVLLTQ